jgi:hypothetical protein
VTAAGGKSTARLTAQVARRIINALTNGVPPPPDVIDFATVGSPALEKRLLVDLSECATGEYRAIALLGDPGTGKTHCINRLTARALAANFAVAHFTQDIATKNTLNRLDRVSASVFESLRLPGLPANENALFSALRRWAALTVDAVGGPVKSLKYLGDACELDFLSVPFLEIPGRTRACLLGLLAATRASDAESALFFMNGIASTAVGNTELIQRCVSLGIQFYKFFIGYTPATSDSKFHISQIRTVVDIIRRVGYSGVVILCDEATGTAELVTRSRQKAYDVVFELLSNAHNVRNCLFVLAFMPDFLVQLRSDQASGMPCFNRAWSETWRASQLELPRLTPSEMAALAVKISELRRLAFEEGTLLGADDAERRAGRFRGSLRDWVKTVVQDSAKVAAE